MLKPTGFVVALGLIVAAGQAKTAPRGKHVQASLVAETDAVQPGQPLTVGVRLQMEPGWHTYWRNPGDAGLPTKAKWQLPEGFSAGELRWPRPIRFHTGPLVSYGYEHEILLPVQIQVPATVPPGDVSLAAKVSWLECQEVCLPGKAELTLTLPVRAAARPGPGARLFETTRRAMPKKAEGWGFFASLGPSIELTVTPPRGTSLEGAYFYPVGRRLLDYSKAQALHAADDGYRLDLPLHPRARPVERLEGVLVGRTAEGEVALEVDVALAE